MNDKGLTMPDITKRHIVIGTAGHIDHGKSALIMALTGVDPDRLKEEKERGMTTDLGFVFYGDDATIIDVPGHEKFVRHMVAGASTIDCVILVVAADDGVMPQTIEHLEILKLLGIKKGIVAITKKDLVTDDILQVVSDDVRELLHDSFLENAPIISVSNTTKDGIDELKKILDELISQTEAKADRGVFRLPIDRSFTMKGFGTVVAGTTLSGKIKIGDTLELLPSKKKVKVRGIEVHNKKVSESGTGFRTAINIVGVEKEEITRGDVLAQPGFYEPSQYLNVSLYLLTSAGKPLKNFTRLRIHLATKEVLGRVVLLDRKTLQPGEKAMAQFRLETPVVGDVNDTYVIRTYSPPTTIGGGVIIEPKAERAKGLDEELIEHLHRLEIGDTMTMVEENVRTNFDFALKIDDIAHDLHLNPSEVKDLIKELTKSGKVLCLDEKRGLYYHHTNFEKLQSSIKNILEKYHKDHPTDVGIPQLVLLRNISRGFDKSLLNYILGKMVEQRVIKVDAENKVSLFEFKVVLDKNLDEMVKKIEKVFLDAGYKPPDYNDLLALKLGPDELVKKAYRYMLDTGLLILVGESVVMHRNLVEQAREKLIEFLKQKSEIRVAEFRDLLRASRRFALPLLVYFDTHNVTIKRGDVRILGQKYR
ncbi:MAG: selenocysteine-specific translation elongation factor [candidate division WOR-3 bacterium]|nr:MAG: selenocysteine-specific translation elongation factor [candidate division WOR-3 bacterium]